MDQVTLVGPGDLGSLRAHALGTALFNSCIDRTFYVMPDTSAAREAFEGALIGLPAGAGAKAIRIPEDSLLSPSVCANKWIYQQLLKFSVDSLRDSHNLSELFFFTDVDTICLRSTRMEDMQHQGRFIFFCSSDNESATLALDFKTAPVELKPRDPAFEDWHLGMSWAAYQLLGLEKAPRLCSVDACVVWSQKIMRKLKRSIADRFSMPWQEAVLSRYVMFIMAFKKCFRRQAGFRDIVFTPRAPVREELGFDELYHNLRIGFSEWQLYNYFLSVLDSSPYVIGLLGPASHPLVAEFNCSVNDIGLLRKIVDSSRKGDKAFPNFIYFYPRLDDAARPTVMEYLEASVGLRVEG